VVLEVLKGNKTINEIVSEMGIHATQITQWKKQAQEGLKEIFADRRGKSQSQEPFVWMPWKVLSQGIPEIFNTDQGSQFTSKEG
jgi:hypothetical protein